MFYCDSIYYILKQHVDLLSIFVCLSLCSVLPLQNAKFGYYKWVTSVHQFLPQLNTSSVDMFLLLTKRSILTKTIFQASL